MQSILSKKTEDGRFAAQEFKANVRQWRFANIHRYDLKIYHTGWRSKCKICTFMVQLPEDACPMKGVDVKALTKSLALREASPL
jgi:hypothetical protein